MRFANHDGRLTLLTSWGGDRNGRAQGIDVHVASKGALPSEPSLAYDHWADTIQWARSGEGRGAAIDIDPARLRAPSPAPRQVFGIGINYADHGAEAKMERPEVPLVFTKLGPSITGPFAEVALSSTATDWEAELVVVIGARAVDADVANAWDHVAGVTVGQDLSDRDIQFRPAANPQFSLGKSLPQFGPTGPFLVTPDEFPDPDDLQLSCRLNGDLVQAARTSEMLFAVPDLIAYLSSLLPLLPGDLIFTGTPSGVGFGRKPPRYLTAGDRLETNVSGIGSMTTTFTDKRSRQLP